MVAGPACWAAKGTASVEAPNAAAMDRSADFIGTGSSHCRLDLQACAPPSGAAGSGARPAFRSWSRGEGTKRVIEMIRFGQSTHERIIGRSSPVSIYIMNLHTIIW